MTPKIGQSVCSIYTGKDRRKNASKYKFRKLDNGFVVDIYFNEKKNTHILIIRDGLRYYEREIKKVIFK